MSDEQQRLRESLRHVMRDRSGREFMRWLIYDVCGRDRESFTGNSQTFYREGQRSIALYLTDSIEEHDPEGYLRMERERVQEIHSE